MSAEWIKGKSPSTLKEMLRDRIARRELLLKQLDGLEADIQKIREWL